MTGELGLAQSTVSGHVAHLRDRGLIGYRSEGRQSFYTVTRPELIRLLQAADGVLAATGSAIAFHPADPCTEDDTEPPTAA